MTALVFAAGIALGAALALLGQASRRRSFQRRIAYITHVQDVRHRAATDAAFQRLAGSRIDISIQRGES